MILKQTMTSVCSLSLSLSSKPNLLLSHHLPIQKSIIPSASLQCHVSRVSATSASPWLSFSSTSIKQSKTRNIICCSVLAEEDETPIVLNDEEEAAAASVSAEQQPVSVPVSPSDLLTMFFQAEGTMSEGAIPAVTSALQETEGISNLKVQVVEAIASVELLKQTTIQATGVASSLVETIQGSGFKLQTLNLSFEDEEEVVLA